MSRGPRGPDRSPEPEVWRAGHRVGSRWVDGWWVARGKRDARREGKRRSRGTMERRIEGWVDADSRIEGRVVVCAGAEVVGSTIRGPAIIGAGTRIEGSFVGPFTSIAERCQVLRSEIEHSVILDDSKIIDITRVEDSLIGKEVVVTRSERRPRANRLMLGDHSQVDLT